jgi:hypothetical protein
MTPRSGVEWMTTTEAPDGRGGILADRTPRDAASTNPLKKPVIRGFLGVTFPEAETKEPIFAKGYLALLLVILSLIEMHV